MSLHGLYKEDVVTCRPGASIVEVARMMRDRHVGDVVVIDQVNGYRKPLGVVTDRDIVLGAVCDNAEEIQNMKVTELMSPDVLTIEEDLPLFHAIRKMKQSGVSRAPVVNKNGDLCGILSASQIFRVLNEEMTELSDLTKHRKEFPQQTLDSDVDLQRPKSSGF